MRVSSEVPTRLVNPLSRADRLALGSLAGISLAIVAALLLSRASSAHRIALLVTVPNAVFAAGVALGYWSGIEREKQPQYAPINPRMTWWRYGMDDPTANRVMVTNGVWNSEGRAIGSLNLYGEIFAEAGYNGVVEMLYNPHEGFVTDLLRARRSVNRTEISGVSQELLRVWLEHFERHPEGQILILGHSEGAVNIRNALELLRERRPDLNQRIHVIAVACAAYIPRDLCGSVQHIVVDGDPVKEFDSKGKAVARAEGSRTKVQPLQGRFEHSSREPVYRNPTIAALRPYFTQN